MVLVVDDDNEVRQVTDRYAAPARFRCGRGRPVLLLVLQRPRAGVIDALPALPAFILLDYAMPEMSGLKLAQALRQKGITIPIALVTGYADLSEADLASAGFVDVLHKPFSMQELRNLVGLLRRHIETRRPETVSHPA